jgi:hypothetical protein
VTRRRHFSAGLLVLTLSALATSGCSLSGGLVVDGGHSSHGIVTVCIDTLQDETAAIFGVGITNTADRALTITGVELLQTYDVTPVTFALASAGRDGLGWGSALVAKIEDDEHMSQAWSARRDAIGSHIEPGGREYLLLITDTAADPRVLAGIRGVKVSFDGSPWPRSTENRNTYGFGPDAQCDPDAIEEW